MNSNELQPIFVFDMDGTLTTVGNRLKYLAAKEWDKFYFAADQDLPNYPMLALFKALQDSGAEIRIVTGRPERTRELTLDWLAKQGIDFPTKYLYMRKNHDFRPDYVLKLGLVKEFQNRIQMVFEDRTQVVSMWRENGIPCCQCRDFEEA